jgi:prophage regulatory protein
MTDNNQFLSDRILRLPEVITKTGLSRSSIYTHVSEGIFPKQIRLGPRSVGWSECEINEWIAERIATSRISW